jgi:hypothetical protein
MSTFPDLFWARPTNLKLSQLKVMNSNPLSRENIKMIAGTPSQLMVLGAALNKSG